MSPQPRSLIASRPHFPGYGILAAGEGEGLLPWSWVDRRLADSRNYWIATTRADGRPHATPVWGVWLENAVVFGVGANSVKARNLARNPHIVVHLESGDEAVILEGTAERLLDTAFFARADEAYAAKYGWHPTAEGEVDLAHFPYFLVRPQQVFAWLESAYPGTATVWRAAGA